MWATFSQLGRLHSLEERRACAENDLAELMTASCRNLRCTGAAQRAAAVAAAAVASTARWGEMWEGSCSAAVGGRAGEHPPGLEHAPAVVLADEASGLIE